MRSLCFVVLVLLSANAFAQGTTTVGDGGHGVQCQNPTLPRVEILDLFEARELYGAGYWAPDADDYLKSQRLDHYNDYLCRLLRDARTQVSRAVVLEPKISHAFDRACELSATLIFADRLSRTSDSGATLVDLPNYCRLVQIGRYEAGHVWLNRSFQMKLQQPDIVAFLLHEALHEVFGGHDTTVIRQFVMYALADQEFQQRNARTAKRLLKTKQPVRVDEFY